MRNLTQAFLILLAMSLARVGQAFLDPGHPRKEVILNQLEEVVDGTLYTNRVDIIFYEKDPSIGLDGAFACGISHEYKRGLYDNYATFGVSLCSTVNWSKQKIAEYKGTGLGMLGKLQLCVLRIIYRRSE